MKEKKSRKNPTNRMKTSANCGWTLDP